MDWKNNCEEDRKDIYQNNACHIVWRGLWVSITSSMM